MVVAMLCVALVYAPVEMDAASAVAKMNTRGTAEVNGAVAPAESSVFSGDRITTRSEAAVALSLPGGDQVFLPEKSAAKVRQDGATVLLALESGGAIVVSRSAKPPMIEAIGVRIEPAGAGIYEIALRGTALKVAARKGTAKVVASNRTMEVPEGKTLDATVAPPPQGQAGAAAGLSALQTGVLVAGVVAGVVGLTLGAVAFSRATPEDCRVTGTTSPFTITCP
jgi:ferric-dicitrate binding protein FerR (iron transport regulator)